MKLHEAIEDVLKSKLNRTSTTQIIADEINRLNLYKKRDGSAVQPSQIMLRTKLSKGRYHHLFEFVEPNIVKLR